MKKIYLFIALFACALCSCGSDEDGMTYAQPVEIGETTDMKTAKEVAETLWATTPLQQQPLNAERSEVLRRYRRWQTTALLISLKAILLLWTSLLK